MKINLKSKEVEEFLNRLFLNFPQKSFNNLEIEQISFRMYLCKKCIESESCSICECNPYDVLGESISCNHGKKFPNFFQNEIQWTIFKQEHNITIK